jgi:hypothetical protein
MNEKGIRRVWADLNTKLFQIIRAELGSTPVNQKSFHHESTKRSRRLEKDIRTVYMFSCFLLYAT